MINEDYKKIINEQNSIKKSFEQKLSYLRGTVNCIVKVEINNKPWIEKTLDSLLGIIPFGIGDYEFHRLNNFYFTIFPQSAKKYKEFYKKIFGKDY